MVDVEICRAGVSCSNLSSPLLLAGREGNDDDLVDARSCAFKVECGGGYLCGDPASGRAVDPEAISAALASVQNVKEEVMIRWMSQCAAEVDCGEGYLYLDLPPSGPWIRQRLGSSRFSVRNVTEITRDLAQSCQSKDECDGMCCVDPDLGRPSIRAKSQRPPLPCRAQRRYDDLVDVKSCTYNVSGGGCPLAWVLPPVGRRLVQQSRQPRLLCRTRRR